MGLGDQPFFAVTHMTMMTCHDFTRDYGPWTGVCVLINFFWGGGKFSPGLANFGLMSIVF